MTARDMRELLRDAANNLYAMADYGGNKNHCAEMEMQSRALRALADRFDAEEESQRWLWDVNDKAADKPGCHTQLACLALLARLNASPLTPLGEPTSGKCEECNGTGKALPVTSSATFFENAREYFYTPERERPLCHVCNGKGKVPTDFPAMTCPACNGTGTQPRGPR